MPAARSSRRWVVALLPALVVAGCLRTAEFGADAPPPPPAEVGVPRDAHAGVSRDAHAGAAPAEPELLERASRAGRNPRVPEGPATQAAAGDTRAGDPATTREADTDALPPGVRPRPAWLGTRLLPPLPDDVDHLETPAELVDRRLPPPPSSLAAPEDEKFAVTIGHVPADVAARSTWQPDCPVALPDLRYLTVTHWGFDERVHTGELIVHASAADGIAGVFRDLFAARFPIEELRVIAMDDLDAPSTGDGNVSSAFVCRRMASGSSWSQHAYGLAVDLNPFHNPYVRGRLVIPGLAGAYLDRADHRPGMIQPGDAVVGAFAAIGWQWGGDWRSSRDWMHFSANGR